MTLGWCERVRSTEVQVKGRKGEEWETESAACLTF